MNKLLRKKLLRYCVIPKPYKGKGGDKGFQQNTAPLHPYSNLMVEYRQWLSETKLTCREDVLRRVRSDCVCRSNVIMRWIVRRCCERWKETGIGQSRGQRDGDRERQGYS
jgi:hypothetical protein